MTATTEQIRDLRERLEVTKRFAKGAAQAVRLNAQNLDLLLTALDRLEYAIDQVAPRIEPFSEGEGI